MLAIAQHFARDNRIDPERIAVRAVARKRARER